MIGFVFLFYHKATIALIVLTAVSDGKPIHYCVHTTNHLAYRKLLELAKTIHLRVHKIKDNHARNSQAVVDE